MSDSNAAVADPVLARVFRVQIAGKILGTCFLAGTPQHLLTAKHVVVEGNEPLKDVKVLVGERSLPASVTLLSGCDVAILRVDEPVVSPLSLDAGVALERGMDVSLYGFPADRQLGPWQLAKTGGPLPDGRWQLEFQTALPAHLGGASGGPVLLKDNRVIGVFVSHQPLVTQHAAFTPVSSFFHLLDFSAAEPDALRCCLIVSEAGENQRKQLVRAVDEALNMVHKRLNMQPRPKPVPKPLLETFSGIDCFRDNEAYAKIVRQLCNADVAILDLTSFEPAILFLLGIRSAVRPGITVGTLGTPLTTAELGKAPFNIKEMNLVSHSDEWLKSESTPLNRILSWRIVSGVEALGKSTGYDDSVCFSSLRHLSPDERKAVPASERALVLCSYAPEYDDNWMEVRRVLGKQLEQQWPDPLPQVARSVDLNTRSGRLISKTMYGAIRRTDFCLVDWTAWPANVFFEFGVRLATHPLGAYSVIQSDIKDGTLQHQLLQKYFEPMPYDRDTCDDVFQKVVETHISRKAQLEVKPAITYSIASEFADVSGDSTAVPVYRELLEGAKLLLSDESLGISAVLYPANPKLVSQTQQAATNRLLAAWEFMSANLADQLFDPTTNAQAPYLEICDLLAGLLKEASPDKARQVYQSAQKLRKAT